MYTTAKPQAKCMMGINPKFGPKVRSGNEVSHLHRHLHIHADIHVGIYTYLIKIVNCANAAVRFLGAKQLQT